MLALKHRQKKKTAPQKSKISRKNPFRTTGGVLGRRNLARHRIPGEWAESHVVHFNGVEDDDDVHLRHKRFKVGPRTPWVITKGFQPPSFNCNIQQFRSLWGVRVTDCKASKWASTQDPIVCDVIISGVPNLKHMTLGCEH